jgi:hypothetical protein
MWDIVVGNDCGTNAMSKRETMSRTIESSFVNQSAGLSTGRPRGSNDCVEDCRTWSEMDSNGLKSLSPRELTQKTMVDSNESTFLAFLIGWTGVFL